MSKIGRNEPCWCGSNKKYKKCHLNKQTEKPLEMWEVDKAFKASYSKKYCSCPSALKSECSGRIINAHTVSKSSSLKSIAKNSHVYGLSPSIFKIHKSNGKSEPELIGINKASTFTGFCSFHDNSLFSIFEDTSFTLEKEQLFLISYRALAREYYTKTAQDNNSQLLANADRGKPQEEQVVLQALVQQYGESLDLGVRDISHHKNKYDEALVIKNYDDIKSCVIELDQILPIQCSGTIYPEVDFKGNELQSLADESKILDLISFSILTEAHRSYAIFSWLPESSLSCEKLIKSFELLSDIEKVQALFKFSFYCFENVYMNPDWWDGLTSKTTSFITHIMNPLNNVKSNYDKESDIYYDEYSIKNIVHV